MAYNRLTRGRAAGAAIEFEGGNDDLIELVTVDPPVESRLSGVATWSSVRGAKQVSNGLVGGGRSDFSASLQSGDFAVTVGEGEEVTVLGLPGIFARIADGGGVAVAKKGECCEEFGFSAERHVLLPGHYLEGEKGVLGVLAELAFGANFNKLADSEEGTEGHCEDD